MTTTTTTRRKKPVEQLSTEIDAVLMQRLRTMMAMRRTAKEKPYTIRAAVEAAIREWLAGAAANNQRVR